MCYYSGPVFFMLWRQILNVMYDLIRIVSSSVSSLFGWDVNCSRCGFCFLSIVLHLAVILPYYVIHCFILCSMYVVAKLVYWLCVRMRVLSCRQLQTTGLRETE
jgi:hypothetical protein